MLGTSLVIFGATLVLGVVLIILHALQRWRTVSRVGLLHGGLGAAALALLIVAVQTASPRGIADGVGTFGKTAGVILGLAFLAGISIWRSRRKPDADPTLLIGLHASLAIFGIVILAAYFAAPT